MAATKLTLSVKAESLPLVKKYAKRQHTSVSKLVQQLFDGIAEEEKKQSGPLLQKFKDTNAPDWLKQLVLAARPTEDFDHKAEYHKNLEEKFGS